MFNVWEWSHEWIQRKACKVETEKLGHSVESVVFRLKGCDENFAIRPQVMVCPEIPRFSMIRLMCLKSLMRHGYVLRVVTPVDRCSNLARTVAVGSGCNRAMHLILRQVVRGPYNVRAWKGGCWYPLLFSHLLISPGFA